LTKIMTRPLSEEIWVIYSNFNIWYLF
jgi:hypothetical protein